MGAQSLVSWAVAAARSPRLRDEAPTLKDEVAGLAGHQGVSTGQVPLVQRLETRSAPDLRVMQFLEYLPGCY